MKTLIPILPLLLVLGGCSSPADPDPGDLADGEFYAVADDRDPFYGAARFEITVPVSEWFPDAYEDTVLFLQLSVDEFQAPGRETMVSTGIFISSVWQGALKKFDLESTTFRNMFLDPQLLDWNDIHQGTVTFTEQTDSLMAGSFDLIAENGYGGEVNVTGAFRAIREDSQ